MGCFFDAENVLLSDTKKALLAATHREGYYF